MGRVVGSLVLLAPLATIASEFVRGGAVPLLGFVCVWACTVGWGVFPPEPPPSKAWRRLACAALGLLVVMWVPASLWHDPRATWARMQWYAQASVSDFILPMLLASLIKPTRAAATVAWFCAFGAGALVRSKGLFGASVDDPVFYLVAGAAANVMVRHVVLRTDSRGRA